ncbi:MAG: KpsF/GutQ family sugar-phosphate isomerase [Planctomycetota bacterium]
MATTPPASNPNAATDTQAAADFARRVLDAESDAIRRISLDASFERAVSLLLQLSGRDGALVVSGVGKSGHIGAKLAATFASTGTPAHFVNPVEAVHGDLGRIQKRDAVLLLSYSGNTEEVVNLAELLKPDGIPIVALVGPVGSDLERLADATVHIGDVAEACPNELAPSSSTTAMLALGDALALTVCEQRRFTADDFAKFHPGGGLGRQLTPIARAMRFKVGENLKLIPQGTPLPDAFEMAKPDDPTLRRAGALVVVDNAGKLAGVFTDGDLRRLAFRGSDALSVPVGDVMTRDPKRLRDDAVVRDAVRLMRQTRIDEVPVVDAEDRPVGLIDVQDLVSLKVIEG